MVCWPVAQITSYRWVSYSDAQLPVSEVSLIERAAAYPDHPKLAELSTERLQKITRQRGIDFATALLFDRLLRSAEHGPFIEEVNSLLRGANEEAMPRAPLRLVIAPGAFHEDRPDFGGDGKLIREVAVELGFEVERIPLAGVGTLRDNCATLSNWLMRQKGGGILLVTLSKAGPEMKLALLQPGSSAWSGKVRAWVNVCGPLNGAPMVDWVLRSRLRTWLMKLDYWWRNRDFEFVTQMCTGLGSPLGVTSKVPSSMKVVNIVGFPLRRHLSSTFARFCHGRIAPLGPNDGALPLSDLLNWPGVHYPAWGADHYFRPETRARTIIRSVLIAVARSLEHD